MIDAISYLERWSYLGILFLAILGNIGVPFPEEAIFIIAGYVAAEGIISLPGAIIACILAIIITNNLSYLAGRWFGRPIFQFLKKFPLINCVIHKAEYLFKHHGKKTMFFSRFIWNIRNYTPLIAGATHMRWRDFQLYDFLAMCIYTPILVLLGFFFSEFLGRVFGGVEYVKNIILILFIAFISYYVIKKIYSALFCPVRQKEDKKSKKRRQRR